MIPDNGLQVYGIAGRGFSGSTLLSMLLGAHSRIFSTGEACRAFQIYKNLIGAADSTDYCAMHHTRCNFWTDTFLQRCNAGDMGILYDRIKEFEPRKDIVVHSFKHPDIYAEMLRRSLRIDGLIILFKRPESFYASAKIHLGQSVNTACNDYAEKYAQILEMSNREDIPVYPLFYEALAINPESCLKLICYWMGTIYEPGMIEPWKCCENSHMIGGNTGAFMHMWNDSVRSWVLQSEYWRKEYTPEHEKWIQENYRTITLDEKWRSLPPDEIAYVGNHEACKNVFEQLLELAVPAP